MQTVSNLTLRRNKRNVTRAKLWCATITLPIVSVGRDAQQNTEDCKDSDEAGPCQDLIVQSETVVIPFAIIGSVQFQRFAAEAGGKARYARYQWKRNAMIKAIIAIRATGSFRSAWLMPVLPCKLEIARTRMKTIQRLVASRVARLYAAFNSVAFPECQRRHYQSRSAATAYPVAIVSRFIIGAWVSGINSHVVKQLSTRKSSCRGGRKYCLHVNYAYSYA